MDERGQQLAQHVGMSAGESFGQHRGQVDIVGSGHRVDSFARVTLTGPSKNHAMTFNHSATTRRYRSSGPTRTPLCWTQPRSQQFETPARASRTRAGVNTSADVFYSHDIG